MTSDTSTALIGTLAFALLLIPLFYIWIPYEIISSRYGYGFKIGALRYFGMFFIVIGTIIGILSLIGFVAQGKGSPIPFSETKELVVTGIYRYVRNPLYLAGSSVLIGEAILFQSLGILIYCMILFAFFYAQALIEETHLETQFGETYNHYRKSVPRWIPNLRAYREKSGR